MQKEVHSEIHRIRFTQKKYFCNRSRRRWKNSIKSQNRTDHGPTTRDIRYYLKSQGKRDELSVAMEASYNWPYYYRAVEEAADNIVLAHPLKTRIIGEAKIKTDKIDSGVLAYMLKADMLPRAYVPSRDTMENKMLLKGQNISG